MLNITFFQSWNFYISGLLRIIIFYSMTRIILKFSFDALTWGLSFFMLLNIALLSQVSAQNILIYTHNGEGNGDPYIHKNIPHAVKALVKMANEQGWQYQESDDPGFFTTENVRDLDCVIFANTNNEAFDTEEQKEVFANYIRNGGGFVGIHSASGSEREWPWYWAMLGGKFLRHPPLQEFKIKVIDPDHPATDFLGGTWDWEDEPYYLNNLNHDIHILLALDYTQLKDKDDAQGPGLQFGSYTPLSWCHTFDGGRQFYTALGHKKEYYKDEKFLKHILGGIQWVLNKE